MKKILLLLFLFATITSNSQNADCGKFVPFKNGQVFYEGVVPVDSASSRSLFDNAKLWIGRTFVNSKAVIDSETANSLIVLKGRIDISDTRDAGAYVFRLILQFKDGRYKYELTDIGIDIYVPSLNFRKTSPVEDTPLFKDCKEAPLILFDTKIKELISSLESGIKDVQDDW